MAIENFLRESSDHLPTIPIEVLQLEKKLSEPVRVHNDDKLRRQKLKQQRTAGVKPALAKGKAKSKVQTQETAKELDSSSKSLELNVAFSKLRVQEEPAATNREPSHIRKAKASDLPPLEHVFAEGLYFTLADIVLMPCIHHFLVRFYLRCLYYFEFQSMKLLSLNSSSTLIIMFLSKLLISVSIFLSVKWK